MKNSFEYGMKVSLNNETGVLIQTKDSNEPGVIRWDTKNESDYEDWTGLFGSFISSGCKIIDDNHTFKFINDNGSLKV